MKPVRMLVLAAAALCACTPSTRTQGNAAPHQPPQYPQQPPPYGAPPPYYGPPQQPFPQQPQPLPQQPPPPAPQQRPLLPPLVGVPAMQQEVRAILGELIEALPANQQALVRGIPLQFDPTIEVNAFAGCENGSPYMAATAGMLEAVDAIAQAKATDELFGTQTYEAYSSQVLPKLAKSDKASPALPPGIIPANLGPDPRRWSRAREIFDDTIAFTFGHELAHHYLGHTGCAHGQPMGQGPDPAKLGRLLTVVPVFNQFAEAHADSAGCENSLAAGRRRRPRHEWSDYGGVTLLDYFARIERAGGGGGPLSLLSPVGFLRSHPNPLARIPLVQTVARNWRARNPG